MYAVIESGGKQYRVELGSEIEVESLTAEAGKTIQIERVLLVADGDETAIGQPTVQGARVSVDVVRHDRGDKIVVFKYQPKARRRVKHGHRQQLTVLRVSDIVLGGRSAAKLAEAERSEREKVEAEAAREADRKAAADRALAARLAKEAEAKQAAEDAEAAKRRPRTGAAGKPSAKSADAKPADAKPKGKATGSGATKAGTTKSTATGKAEGGTVRRVQAPLPKPRSAGSTPTTKSTAPSKSSTTGKTSAAGKSTTTSKTSPASKSSTTPRPRSAAKTTKDT